MSTATATLARQHAERLLVGLTVAVDEYRASELATKFASQLRIVWLRDLYTTDDQPRAWIVPEDATVADIEDAEHHGIELGTRTELGSAILNALEDGDEPLRNLAVGEVTDVDNSEGAGGFVATLTPSYTPSESAQRIVAAHLVHQQSPE